LPIAEARLIRAGQSPTGTDPAMDAIRAHVPLPPPMRSRLLWRRGRIADLSRHRRRALSIIGTASICGLRLPKWASAAVHMSAIASESLPILAQMTVRRACFHHFQFYCLRVPLLVIWL
jgi:hypothetical protein